MPAPITPVFAPVLPSTPSPLISAPKTAGFASLLGDAIQTVESTQSAAKASAADLLLTGKGDIHDVALAGQRAELTLDLVQQVRNKLVQAYQEVMRMPM